MIGTVVPFTIFVPWVIEHGFAPALFVDEASATTIGRFFSADLIITALVLLMAAWTMLGAAHALIISTVTLCIGVSAGLPLFLYFQLKGQR